MGPTVRAVREWVRIEPLAKDRPASAHRSTAPQRRPAVAVEQPCDAPLAEAREVSKTLGVTINDVFGVCAGRCQTWSVVALPPTRWWPRCARGRAAERAHPCVGRLRLVTRRHRRPARWLGYATHPALQRPRRHGVCRAAGTPRLPTRAPAASTFGEQRRGRVSRTGRWRVDHVRFSTGRSPRRHALNMTAWMAHQFNPVMADAAGYCSAASALARGAASRRSLRPGPRPRRWPAHPTTDRLSPSRWSGPTGPTTWPPTRSFEKPSQTGCVRCLPAQPGSRPSITAETRHRCCGVETVEPEHRIRHLALPAPGSMPHETPTPACSIIPDVE